MMKILGLTGGMGTGVSTTARLFASFGAHVVSADAIAARALKNHAVKSRLTAFFGEKILSGTRISRQKLSALAFSSAALQKKLVHITHPFILRAIKKELAALQKKERKKVSGKKQGLLPGKRQEMLAVIDAPLLFESGLAKSVDCIAVVWCPEKVQFARLQKKHFSLQQARKRMRFQKPLQWKAKHADVVIRNAGSLQETKKQVLKVFRALLYAE